MTDEERTETHWGTIHQRKSFNGFFKFLINLLLSFHLHL